MSSEIPVFMPSEPHEIHALLDELPSGILLSKKDGSILYANKAACQILGYRQQECVKLQRQDLVDIKDPNIRSALDSRDRNKYFKGRLVFKKKNGESFPVEVQSSVFQQEGSAIRYLLIFRDISEEIRLENELSQSYTHLDLILNNSEEGFILLDSEFRIIAINKITAQKNLEFGRKAIGNGDSIFDFLEESRLEIAKENYKKALQGKTLEVERIWKNNQGQKRLIHTEIRPAFGPDQHIQGVVQVIRDITEKRKLEEELQDLLKTSNSIFDNSLDLICTLDAGGIFVNVSKAGQNILGFPMDQMLGQSVKQFMNQKYWSEFDLFLEKLKSGKRINYFECWFTHQKGFEVPVIWSGIWSEEQQRYFTIVKDARERHQLEWEKFILQELPVLIQKSTDFKSNIKAVLGFLAKEMNFIHAELWMPERGKKSFRLNEVWIKEASDLNHALHHELTQSRIKVGIQGGQKKPIPKHPIWKEGYKQFDSLELPMMNQLGLNVSLQIPLWSGDDFICLLCFFGSSSQELKHSSDFLERIAAQLGPAMAKAKSDYELQSFFDLSRDIMCMVTENGQFLKVNKTFCKKLGYKSKEIEGQSLLKFVHPEDHERTWAVLKGGGEVQDLSELFINRYLTKEAKILFLEWNYSLWSEEGIFVATAQDITHKVESEAIIKRSNKTLRNILSSIQEGFIMTNPSFKVLEVNKAALRMLGKKRQDLINKELTKVFPEIKTLKEIQEPFLNLQKGEEQHFQSFNAENHLWLEYHAYPDSEGYSIFIRNVSDTKNTEELLHIERKALIQVAKPHTDFDQTISFLLNETQSLYPNFKVLIFNYISDEKSFYYVGDRSWNLDFTLKMENLINSSRMRSVNEALKQATWKMVPIKKEIKEVHSMLKEEKIKASWVSVVRDGEGRIIGLIIVLPKSKVSPKEIDKKLLTWLHNSYLHLYQNQANIQGLQKFNERYKLLAQVLNEAVWELDFLNSQFTFGEGFKRIFHLNSGNLDISEWENRIHPNDKERVIKSLKRYLRGVAGSTWTEQYLWLNGKNQYADVLDRAKMERSSSGVAVRVVGSMQDITELKKQEKILQKLNSELEEQAKELAASNEDLERFAYVASHDLQEPLRMVSSFLSLLEMEHQDQLSMGAQEYVRYALKGAERMKGLIKDLLEYSKIGNKSIQLVPIDFSAIMELIQSDMDLSIQEKQAILTYDSCPLFYGDPGQLKQLFQNLISNGIKYQPKGQRPEIKIKCTSSGDSVEFQIKDNGIGIDPEHFNQIFEIFQRLHRKADFEGTGIGLAICKKIVDKHNGEIWVTSKPRQGSTFFVKLPVSP